MPAGKVEQRQIIMSTEIPRPKKVVLRITARRTSEFGGRFSPKYRPYRRGKIYRFLADASASLVAALRHCETRVDLFTFMQRPYLRPSPSLTTLSSGTILRRYRSPLSSTGGWKPSASRAATRPSRREKRASSCREVPSTTTWCAVSGKSTTSAGAAREALRPLRQRRWKRCAAKLRLPSIAASSSEPISASS